MLNQWQFSRIKGALWRIGMEMVKGLGNENLGRGLWTDPRREMAQHD
jgi:hypothetical protein